MDTSNPSRPKGKIAGLEVQNRARASQAYWVSLTSKEGAPPFAIPTKDGLALTDHGRALAEFWIALGEDRPSLASDDMAIGPRSIQGILRIKSSGADPLTLTEAVRLFKAGSARALAAVGRPKPRASKAATGDNPPVTSGAAPAIWKKGYSERELQTLKQVVEARAALKRFR